MGKLVCGVGKYEKGEFVSWVGGEQTKEYHLWSDMLRRCYSDKFQAKWTTYIGCSVSDNFKNFQYFAKWCQNQIGFGLAGYQIDKDLVIKGNKVYSEDTCFFVPMELNSLLTKCDAIRGEYPIGVDFNRACGKFRAHCNDGSGEKKYLGSFTAAEAAFKAYKIFKEALAARLAIKYSGLVDQQVIEALNSYLVEITD